MRSGMTAMVRAVQRSTPWIVSVSVPMPVDLGAHRDQAVGEVGDLGLARGVDQPVSPSASAAAISRFSVAPTETKGKMISAPRQALGRARLDIALVAGRSRRPAAAGP